MEHSCIWNFKPKWGQNKLPESWEEFCEPLRNEELAWYVDSYSNICKSRISTYDAEIDRNLLPDKETAEAIRALNQLIQLRDCYNDGWLPSWDGLEHIYTFEFNFGEISECEYGTLSAIPLFFKNSYLRDKFILCFRPLIEQLKPLYGIKTRNDDQQS